MSSFKTYADIKTFVQNKLNLLEETFITSSELLTYCEEAIQYCESEIHKLNIEDMYFTACANIPLVSGQTDYALPANIYANKVLRFIYVNGSEIYSLLRMKNQFRYEDTEITRQYNNSGPYSYVLVNNDPRVGTKFKLTPKSRETSPQVTLTGGGITSGTQVLTVTSTAGVSVDDFIINTTYLPPGTRVQSVDSATQLTLSQAAIATAVAQSFTSQSPRVICWYIRKASVPVASTDYIDFPEFWPFIAQHMIVECLKKELGNPRLTAELQKLDQLNKQVLETLSNMVPDQQDTIEKDLSMYQEQNTDSGDY